LTLCETGLATNRASHGEAARRLSTARKGNTKVRELERYRVKRASGTDIPKGDIRISYIS